MKIYAELWQKARVLEYIKRINIYMKQKLWHFIAGLSIAIHKVLPATILSFIFTLTMLHVIGRTVFYDKTSVVFLRWLSYFHYTLWKREASVYVPLTFVCL